MAYNKTTWEDLPSTNTPINANNLNNIENGVEEAIKFMGVPDYSTSTSYVRGNLVKYNNKLYRAVRATSGSWNSADWSETSVRSQLERTAGWGEAISTTTATDWNSLGQVSGFFRGSGLTHSPSGKTVANWWFVVQLAESSGYYVQYAFPYGYNTMYMRAQNNGTWNDWTEIDTNGTELYSGNGTAATLTLSESIANYKHFRVEYLMSNYVGSAEFDVRSSNYYYTISTIRPSDADEITITNKRFTIDGTTLTVTSDRFPELKISPSGISTTSSSGDITRMAITKIVGYK